MESTSHKSRFLSQLYNSFGSGGMSLPINEAQFSSFIQFLKQESRGQLAIKKAVTITGEQPDHSVWVLSSDLQIDRQGSVVPATDNTYVWMDLAIGERLGSVRLEEFVPTITPLDSKILNAVVKQLKLVMRHNFFPALLMAGGAVMSLHYTTIVPSGGCPIVVAHGNSQTGKSTAIGVGLSIMGK